ncbi:MAG TPA: DUF2877 domain-containing protein [Nocardioides sp.]|nr:DUF2877 domain-containing protein [Nocardioides sp.]
MSPTASIPVSAPPRVRDLIRSAPDGPVPIVHAGPHAVYVALDGPEDTRCVGVLGRGAAQVPCGLRTRIRDFRAWRCESAYVAGGTLHVDHIPLTVGRAVAVQVPPLGHRTIPRRTASPATATATPQAVVVGLVPQFTAATVGQLLGRGPGLTPLGDDVICGWIATHRAAGVPTPEIDTAVRAGLPRTTLLSGTLLDCALHGEVLPELGRYLAAVGTHAEARRAAELRAVGGTSGAGLLMGALLALDELLALEGAA